MKNHSEPTTPMSNFSLTSDSKASGNVTKSSSNSRHDPISTSSRQQQQQARTAIVYTTESNYRTYKTSESYADEDADLFQTNLCQVDRISTNLDSNQEYVPIESVKRFLIDDVSASGSHVDGAGKGEDSRLTLERSIRQEICQEWNLYDRFFRTLYSNNGYYITILNDLLFIGYISSTFIRRLARKFNLRQSLCIDFS